MSVELHETCHSQSRTALAPSTRHHNNKWPEFRSSNVAFNFLLVAKMQQHDPAREPGLQFAASPNAPHRVHYVVKSSLLYSCINFISRSSWENFRVHNQGTVQQTESTILLSIKFSLDLTNKSFGETSQF